MILTILYGYVGKRIVKMDEEDIGYFNMTKNRLRTKSNFKI